jgi:hypothetical protein
MNRTLLVIALILWFEPGKLFSADDLPLAEEFGLPLRQPSIEIVWNTTLDSLPRSAMVFRVVSKEYSPTSISNLLEITGFSARDRVRRPGLGNRLFFRDRENEDRYLGIVPDDGWVFYQDSKAIALPKEAIEDIASEEQVLKLAEAMILKLGIDDRELATSANGKAQRFSRTVQERTTFDKSHHKVTKTAVARGVILIRRIDDIESGGVGNGGTIRFEFGNHGQLARLDWVWRALKPQRLCRIATRDELTDWIRGGRCVLDGWQELSISALTITNATPYYFEKREDDPQQYLYPFVRLDAQAKVSDTNIPVRVYCPLVIESEQGGKL